MITKHMVKDLLVRGFDDEIHSKLGNVAGKMGVSPKLVLIIVPLFN